MSRPNVPNKSGVYNYYKYDIDSYELRRNKLEYVYTGDYYIVYGNEEEKAQLYKKAKRLQMLNKLVDGLFFTSKLLFWTCVVLGVLFVLGYVLIYFPLLKSCENTGLIMGLPHKFNVWAGCFINYKGMWIPSDQIIRAITGK